LIHINNEQILKLGVFFEYLCLGFLDDWQERQQIWPSPGDHHLQEEPIDDTVQC
jgi:hypothetical protein